MIDPVIAAASLFALVAAVGLSFAQPAPLDVKVRAVRRDGRRG